MTENAYKGPGVVADIYVRCLLTKLCFLSLFNSFFFMMTID